MSIKYSSTPAPSRPHSPQLRYFAGSPYGLDDISSRSQSRARPVQGLPDLALGDILTRRSTLREPSESSSLDRSNKEGPRLGARFDLPAHESSYSKTSEPRIIPSPSTYINSRDERGEEMDEDSRVWRIYIDEATKVDSAMTDGWNRSLDVLLVFTGLFSAVITTFIVQSYSQFLIPNPADTTNILLAELILLQFNTSTTVSRSVSAVAYPSISETGQAHWVNGLWFAALVCSLSSALVSMLAKQWLVAYLPSTSGPLRSRARARQSRFMQLEAWHVPTIINALPMLLHVALLLFFAGLIVLLWSSDLGITLSTLCIVAFAYCFYVASIVLPILYPDCPYRHPIAEQIQKWTSPKFSFISFLAPSGWLHNQSSVHDLESTSPSRMCHALPDDVTDAKALCWLFTNSNDNRVVSSALQAIAGLPRNFSALYILRDAGALHLIEQGFQSCYHKDTSVDLQWHLKDVDGAELYCRSWMKLTWGTTEKWPLDMVDPLWILSDLKTTHPNAAAFAACAVALSSFDTLSAQWELLSFLAKHVSGEIQLAQTTQCWILDSICQCLNEWEVPRAVIERTTSKAVPIILGVLRLTEDVRTSSVRSAATLALYAFTRGPVDLSSFDTEEKRCAAYCEMTVQSLAVIVDSPDAYGVKESLLDLAAEELARLASPVVAQSERFPHALRALARASLSKLYISGRLSNNYFDEGVLANVLQLLFPPKEISVSQHPIFVTVLVDTLENTSHPELTNWAVRLLEALLTQCPMPVSQAFSESNGVNAVLRAAKAGNVDSRRLQIDSLRALCAFIDSSTSIYTQSNYFEGHPDLDRQFDLVFKSDFFETLCSVVASRRWWLFEVSGHWMPALLQLCYLRPKVMAWRTVIKTFQDFAERNVEEEGYTETMRQLKEMKEVIFVETDSCQSMDTVG